MRIGLALSGGAARGIAHIGVIKYLEEREIKPGIIAGTSAGSIVGALYCSGMSVDEIIDIAPSISWKDMFKISIPSKGLIKSSQLLKLVEKYIGNVTFDQLKIPLLINAVDLISGKEVVIEEGKVAVAVEASCAIPGIFTPVRWKDKLLVDGGLLDNIPATHLESRDLDYIIAVNVGAQKPLQKEPDSIFEILIQSYDIIRRQRDIPAYKCTDTLIEPDLGDIAFWDTGKTDLLVKRGYQAARLALENVKFEKKTGYLARWFGRKKDKQR